MSKPDLISLSIKAVLGALRSQLSPQTHPHVLLACFPKSASSYLASIIGNLPGVKEHQITLSRINREQEIDLLVAARYADRGYVAQQHIRFSAETDEWLKALDVTPIVLTRNIFDIVVSLRDHVRKEGAEGSMAWISSYQTQLPDVELEGFIARMIIPWYISFFASWQHCRSAIWIDYEEVTSDTENTVKTIARSAGIKTSRGDILLAISNANKHRKRFNVGTPDRGASLTDETRQHIKDLASYYPQVDFTSIGL
jgi:hypothetical protein